MNARNYPILLVEDNPDDILLTKRAFKKSNISNELSIAEDGQQAIDMLFGEGDYEGKRLKPIVVLLDLQLPKIGGLDVLRRIREDSRTRHLPVVVLTSSNEESDVVTSYDLNVNSYIRKPVDFNQFAEAILTLQLYWVVLNEPPPDIGS